MNFAEGLRSLPPDTPLDSDIAARFLEQATGDADVDLYEMRGWPSYVNDGTLEDLDWTAGRLLECVQVVAKQAKMDADELLNGMTQAARDSLDHAQRELAKLRASHDRERRALLLPDSLTMEKMNRYETTLERSLYKALHELERRQAARDGQAVPLPVAVDVNLIRPGPGIGPVGLFGKKRPNRRVAAVQTTGIPDVLGESVAVGVNISKRMLDRAGGCPGYWFT